jgi:hypothetical protein
MMLIKGDREPGHLPSEEFLAQMGKYNKALSKAGLLLDLAALQWSAEGVRVRFSSGERIVIDGPFGEAKAIVAGDWILRVVSMGEAMEWVKRLPFAAGGEPRLKGRSSSASCSSWRSSVSARRWNGGPARGGAAQEQGVTALDQPSGD